MKFHSILMCLALCLGAAFSEAQVGEKAFSRADSLRGTLSPLRSCYNVLHYAIDIRFLSLEGQPDAKGDTLFLIRGSVVFRIQQLQDFQRLQIDLFDRFQIDSIVYANKQLAYNREAHAVFVDFGKTMTQGDTSSFKVYYQGPLIRAKNAPWDGGFVFSRDAQNRPWIGVACEGLGASSWWPCKDHLSDEPDQGISLRVAFPERYELLAVANGRLKATGQNAGFRYFDWEVVSPINSYNVSIYIGSFAKLSMHYQLSNGQTESLDHYVLDYNLSKAEKHFAQIGPMLDCFEQVFGPYAFWVDGFKLVESPYWGMEHQSAIAYGNNYRNNRWGFDFIIIHESGHEWWGNAVSVAEHADMWIHEGFTTYSETLYLECQGDSLKAQQYLDGQRKLIRNAYPLVGPYGVNYQHKDTDIYYKGAWMLHSFRKSLEDEQQFYQWLRECYAAFSGKQIQTAEMLEFWLSRMGESYRSSWEHYLYTTHLPVLAWRKGADGKTEIRWEQCHATFYLPMQLASGHWVIPSHSWQPINTEVDFAYLQQKYLIAIGEGN
jgi:aminopeptidase N